MKIKLKINGKMLVYVLGTAIIVFVVAMAYITLTLRDFSKENSQKILQAKSTEISNQIEQKLNLYMNATQVLAEAFTNFDMIPEKQRRAVLSKFLEDALKNNPEYFATWSICEANSIDNLDAVYSNQPGSSVSGSFKYSYYNHKGEIKLSDNAHRTKWEEKNEELYYQIKNNPAYSMSEPYYWAWHGEKDSLLQTSIAYPIIKGRQFMGVVGINLPLLHLQDTFSRLSSMEEARIYLISHEGKIVTHPDSKFLGRSFADYAPSLEKRHQILNAVSEVRTASFIDAEPQTGEESMFYFNPVYKGKSNTPWAFGLSVPVSVLYDGTNRTFTFALFVGLLGLIFISFIIFGIANSITKPLRKATENLKLIAKGDIQNLDTTSDSIIKDEISDMNEAMTLLTDSLKSATKFAQEIGKGNLDVNFKSQGEKDLLGNSLVTMKESLAAAHVEEEKKRIEDEKRNWVTHGLASFGEIIRQHNDDMQKFTLNVTRNLIDYLGASQGAMYINQQIEADSNSQAEFELLAAIAYGKQVMLTKTVISGQELLGRAIEENKTIHLEDIPERYVLLSPGMKKNSRPRNLLIIPITINEVPMGIFELLSYSRFEPYHIEFIEKLSENIASVISSVKTNIRTTQLLAQSQEQADILAQHEEEMRQNLEEMQATQEESAKREENLKSFIKAVKSLVMTVELDVEGKILDMSNSMCVVYGVNLENMKGKYYDAIITQDNDSRKEFGEFWSKMIHNGSGKRKQLITHRNKETWVVESYKVIQRDRMSPIVLVMAVDRTREKEMEDMLAAELKGLK